MTIEIQPLDASSDEDVRAHSGGEELERIMNPHAEVQRYPGHLRLRPPRRTPVMAARARRERERRVRDAFSGRLLAETIERRRQLLEEERMRDEGARIQEVIDARRATERQEREDAVTRAYFGRAHAAEYTPGSPTSTDEDEPTHTRPIARTVASELASFGRPRPIFARRVVYTVDSGDSDSDVIEISSDSDDSDDSDSEDSVVIEIGTYGERSEESQ